MGRKLTTIVGILCSVLFLWLALRKVDLREVADALGAVNRGQLTLALGTLAVCNVLVTVRWRYLVSQAQSVDFLPVFSAVMIGYFANNVLPARAGEFLRAHVLGRRTDLSRTFTFATIVVERTFDLVTMLLFLLVVMVGFPLPAWTQRVGVGAACLIAVVGVMLAGILWGGDHLAGFLRLPALRRALTPLRSRITPFRDGLQILTQGRRLATVAFLSLLIWLVSTLTVALTLSSLNIHIPPYGIFFTLAVVNLGLAIPSSPGFIGTYQFLCVSALGFFHVSKSTAFTYSLVQHALWYIPITLIGFIFFWRENLRMNRLPITQEATTL